VGKIESSEKLRKRVIAVEGQPTTPYEMAIATTPTTKATHITEADQTFATNASRPVTTKQPTTMIKARKAELDTLIKP
jgi:hypothetical protein